MRRLFAAVLCALTVFVFSACSGFGNSIEDLLAAPKLNADQSAVLGVLNAGRETAVRLEYPVGGEYRTPIQFIDLDGDGSSEALLCYCDSQSSVYARLALLSKQNDVWTVIADIEGPGTDIYSISIVDCGDSSSHILIEWAVIGRSVHEAIIYQFADGKLSEVFSQSCLRYILYDLTGGDSPELCVIYPESSEGPFALRVVEYINGAFVRAGYATLNANTIDCINLTGGMLGDGTRALFVDENIGSNRQTTQVFCYTDDGFKYADYISRDIASLAVRYLDSYGSTRINGQTLVPAQLTSADSSLQSGWIKWFDITAGVSGLNKVMYLQKQFTCGICIPPDLVGKVEIKAAEGEPRRISVVPVEYEGDAPEPLVELKILVAGEAARIYINEGFSPMGQTDRFRYYIKVNCDDDIAQYVISNFVVFEV